jgi:hypothetical protein
MRQSVTFHDRYLKTFAFSRSPHHWCKGPPGIFVKLNSPSTSETRLGEVLPPLFVWLFNCPIGPSSCHRLCRGKPCAVSLPGHSPPFSLSKEKAPQLVDNAGSVNDDRIFPPRRERYLPDMVPVMRADCFSEVCSASATGSVKTEPTERKGIADSIKTGWRDGGPHPVPHAAGVRSSVNFASVFTGDRPYKPECGIRPM